MIVDADIPPFIDELHRAANEIERISWPKRAKVLKRAAQTAGDVEKLAQWRCPPSGRDSCTLHRLQVEVPVGSKQSKWLNRRRAPG